MEKEIKVKDLFSVLRRHLWLIALITMTTTVISGFYSLSHTIPMYQSSTQILMPLDKPDYLKTFEDILKNSVVMDQVAQRLGLNRSSDKLSGQITFANKDGSDIVEISAVDADPVLAAKISNTAASVFIQQISNIFGIYNSKILSEAKAAKAPLPINQMKKFEIGFAVGIVLSLGLVFLLDSLDNTVKTEREIERLLELPVLGGISKMKVKNTSTKRRKSMSPGKGGAIRA